MIWRDVAWPARRRCRAFEILHFSPERFKLPVRYDASKFLLSIAFNFQLLLRTVFTFENLPPGPGTPINISTRESFVWVEDNYFHSDLELMKVSLPVSNFAFWALD